MAMVKCSKCGEIHYSYDAFCPKCGASGDASFSCDGNCTHCAHEDIWGGCSVKASSSDILSDSHYPGTVLRDKHGNLSVIEETDKRSRAATVALAFFITGAFGIHDFYARRYWQGLIHALLFTLSLVGAYSKDLHFLRFGFIISWALSVLCGVLLLVRMIDRDGKGYPFS